MKWSWCVPVLILARREQDVPLAPSRTTLPVVGVARPPDVIRVRCVKDGAGRSARCRSRSTSRAASVGIRTGLGDAADRGAHVRGPGGDRRAPTRFAPRPPRDATGSTCAPRRIASCYSPRGLTTSRWAPQAPTRCGRPRARCCGSTARRRGASFTPTAAATRAARRRSGAASRRPIWSRRPTTDRRTAAHTDWTLRDRRGGAAGARSTPTRARVSAAGSMASRCWSATGRPRRADRAPRDTQTRRARRSVARSARTRASARARCGARCSRSRRNGATFVFAGRGFGHGVGLCQAGALARLRAGAHADQRARALLSGHLADEDAPTADEAVALGQSLTSTHYDVIA